MYGPGGHRRRRDYPRGDIAPRYFSDRTGGYEGDRRELPGWRSDKPVTRRVGAGKRARIAIESGGQPAAAPDYGLREQVHLEAAGGRRPEMSSSNRDYRRTRHRSAQYASYSSPAPDRARQPYVTSSSESEDSVLAEPFPARTELDTRTAIPRRRHPRIAGEEDDCDFKLPPKVEAVTYDYVEEVSFPIDVTSKEDTNRQSQPARSKFTGAVTEVPIMQSRWLGSAFDRGDLSAAISTAGSSTQKIRPHDSTEPLMKWYHLERSLMSFEEFISAAQSVLQVTEQKRRDINKLLRDVQRKFEKQRQHGRDLEPDCVSDLFVGDASTKESACVIFMSFPYFCLEPYNAAQLKNLTPGTPMHPLRPLLQAHFHSTSQKRELAQAVTNFPNTGNGNCIHLSQVWCLVVDDNTMMTCSRQSHETLCDPAITKSEANTGEGEGKVKVSFGSDRSWQIPVSDNTSWPTFLSLFGETAASLDDDGAAADFKINRDDVDARQWSFLVTAAQTTSIGIDLQQKPLPQVAPSQMIGAIPAGTSMTVSVEPATYAPTAQEQQPPRGHEDVSTTTDAVEPPVVATAAGPTEQAHQPSDHHDNVPTTVSAAEFASPDEEESLAIFQHAADAPLETLAQGLNAVLQSNSREKERKAYEQTAATESFATRHWNFTNRNPPNVSDFDFLGMAFYLFRFFWPLSFRHTVTDKYWGAVQGILQQDTAVFSRASVDRAIADLRNDIVPVMQSLTREFSASQGDLTPLPEAYSKAFLHLIMIFVLISQTTEQRGFGVNNSTIRAHLRGTKDALTTGKREITSRLKEQSKMPDLEELEVCSHTSLLTLVLNQFSQDVMHGKPDVASTYNDYFAQLDFRITEDPTPRAHQESLRFFLQEVEAILSTLQYQITVLEAFEQSLLQQRIGGGGDEDNNNNSLLRYALGESRQQLVLDDCKARISARIDKFRGLQRDADELGEWHRNEMETNRDRQENAIMVFTIVTIVFLPLSFVSSVFGMNTSDVRDMPYSQWAYWAAGVPLTVLVVFGSLWWAGEFEGFGSWVQRTLSRASSASGGYERIPEPATSESRRIGRRGDARYAGSRREADFDVYPPPPPVASRRTTYPRRRYR